MLNILKSLRGARRQAKLSPPALWRIDLGPVDEPMMNGRAERISFTTTERISLSRTKRVAAPPIGRAAQRDFDWRSVAPTAISQAARPRHRHDPDRLRRPARGRELAAGAVVYRKRRWQRPERGPGAFLESQAGVLERVIAEPLDSPRLI